MIKTSPGSIRGAKEQGNVVMSAGNGWYHVNGNTYGTWLPGDPRGWREKKHKNHVPGDYRNPPPPGFGARLHTYARAALKQEPVRLNVAQREIAGKAIIESFFHQTIEIIALSMDAIHFHLLLKCPDSDVRRRVGWAKQSAWFSLRTAGLGGKVWERNSNVTPIRSREHQTRVFEYI